MQKLLRLLRSDYYPLPSSQSLWRFCQGLCLLFSITISAFTQAAPVSYSAEYDARLQGFRAKAEMSLANLNDGEFRLNSSVRVRLLGKTITSINEESHFIWKNDSAQPISYHFQQNGIGKKSRAIEYYWDQQRATTLVDDDELNLTLHEGVLDELSMYVEIKRQISQGIKDIVLAVIDEDEIKQYHYQVVGEETISTVLGDINTLKVERIRDAGSNRITQLWFALDWDYLLIKLFQKNSKGKESQLTLRSAIINSLPLTLK